MDIANASSSNKRRQKLCKKARSGGVSSAQMFLECRSLGIAGRSSLALVKDPTRASCLHDLNVQELRDMLLSLLTDEAPSKFFDIRNKAFLRHVAVLHVQDLDDGAVLKGSALDMLALWIVSIGYFYSILF